MNKQQFLKTLKDNLAILSYEEQDAAMKYYEEYFDDAGVENEQNVIAELGNPVDIAEGILAENGSVPERIKKAPEYTYRTTKLSGVFKLLFIFFVIIMGIPFILGIGGASIGLIFGGLGILIAIIFGGVGLMLAGGATLFTGIMYLLTSPLNSSLFIGVGLCLFGVGIIFSLLVFWLILKITIPLFRGVVNLIGNMFNKRRV